MSTRGLDKLEAVQRVAQVVHKDTVAALETGQPTVGGYAEQTIDEVAEIYLTSGQASNTRYYQTVTAAGGAFPAPADALSVRAAGPDTGRSFELQGTSIVDIYRPSLSPANGDTITVDVVTNLAWDDIAPTAKEVIVAEAARRLQQRFKNNPQTDAWLAQQVLAAETMAVADRPAPMRDNTFVFSRGLAAGQQQDDRQG